MIEGYNKTLKECERIKAIGEPLEQAEENATDLQLHRICAILSMFCIFQYRRLRGIFSHTYRKGIRQLIIET